MEQVTVLGSTGSIGVSTLDVLREHETKYKVFALTARNQIDKLVGQCQEFKPVYVVVLDSEKALYAQKKITALGLSTRVLCGVQSLNDVASANDVDIVVAAIVGAAGLEPTLAGVKSGKKVLLANKESLVMAGDLFMSEVKAHNACLMPVDSEHNAIFQCLPERFESLELAGVSRILLTGSGGPFRNVPLAELQGVTPEQACAHPNWDMGKKISVDSATMMNKGLEYIETCWLFNARPKQISVVLHPQSIVHSMVEYIDGSVLAQMGVPDMRTPIANCLSWPKRIKAPVKQLDFINLKMEFFEPDFKKFPCLKLAIQAMANGGAYPAMLNAVNEIAVEAFLQKKIAFTAIAELVDDIFQAWRGDAPLTLDDVLHVDHSARAMANQRLSERFIR